MTAALATIVVLYVAGYVTGAVLLPPSDQRLSASLGVVRLVAGLFVTSTGFLLSLAVGAPWVVGPLVGLLLALVLYRQRALMLPSWPQWTGWTGAVAVVVAAVLVAPFMIALARMAQGPFPPVFYNVDSPYFLEKVHALLHTDRLPPPSLGVLGGTFSYHYGVQGIAAVITHSTGLLPHQATFGVTLPLLVLGSLAAAIVAAEVLSPAVPFVLSVPFLLVVSPTLWHPFWQHLTNALAARAAGSGPPLQNVAKDYELWGFAALTGQNLATPFLVLAVVGSIAAAQRRGWRLPVFLVGSAVLFKAPTGVALMGGFATVLAWRGVRSRSIRPFLILGAAVGLFGIVYSALWILPPLPKGYMTELSPFFHVRWLREQGRLSGFLLDLLWLVAPAVPLLIAGRKAVHDQRLLDATPGLMAILAIAPLVIINTLRGVDIRPGRGIDYDWFQVVLPVPILAHAAVLALAGRSWPALGRTGRRAVAGLMVLAVAAPVGVAANYAARLLTNPSAGHEFVDNRAIGAALQAIPTSGSVIVTNDLRYPAEGFSRDYRQMQIPALFGHQAFAVNYAYEAYDFLRDRLALQRLLQADRWVPEIDAAAQTYGWTHLLIRKDYRHPAGIPLTQVFDGEQYAVYQFPTPPGASAEHR